METKSLHFCHSTGREKVTQMTDPAQVDKLRESSPDLKESMEIGKEPSETFQNNWPAHDRSFRDVMLVFFDVFTFYCVIALEETLAHSQRNATISI